MPEYSSKSRTLCIYVCICICEAWERCLLMELSVMKIVEVDFIVVCIFCSFNDVFVSSWVYKCLWGLIGLLSDYHNRFIHVYLDDIFTYLRSIKEHKKHLGIVFQQLRDHHLFLSKSKVDLYSKRLECLGHIIDDQGIHVVPIKCNVSVNGDVPGHSMMSNASWD